MPDTATDLYAELGVPPSATAEQLHQAYLALARNLHPDVNRAADAEQRVLLPGERQAGQVLGRGRRAHRDHGRGQGSVRGPDCGCDLGGWVVGPAGLLPRGEGGRGDAEAGRHGQPGHRQGDEVRALPAQQVLEVLIAFGERVHVLRHADLHG